MVGPERAQRLIEARPLRSWEDVERVPGFDGGMIDDLKSGGARVGNASYEPLRRGARKDDMMPARAGANHAAQSTAAFRWPGILIGMALAGFLDGLLFHEILEWHHMWSGYSDDPRTNMLADGLFHAAMYLILVAGLIALWRAPLERRGADADCAFWGWVVVGFGLFNAVEGAVDHLLLGMHHVRMGVPDPRPGTSASWC
jgi:uncharacterized membrane protein